MTDKITTMGSQELGSSFEILTKDFFYSLFEEIGLQINNHWIQKAGMQGGFDVGFEIAVLNDSFFTRSIFIECKNYAKSRLDQAQLHTKLLQFAQGGYKKENSIFIFLSPKADLSKSPQDCNPKHLEDFFGGMFKFKVVVMTPNSRVKDILSLNKEIYKAVYGESSFISPAELHRKNILDYFSTLFRSKGELPDFDAYTERRKYLEEAAGSKSREVYIKRTVNSNGDLFQYSEETLLDALKENQCVLLLGEPGSGKTTEMIKAANFFKERIATLEITPIFKSLSNVNEFKTIEGIMPEDWKEHEKVVLFLDAWDEFEDREKLADELMVLKEIKETGIKVVISCRTYAYKDELALMDPVKLYLNGFTPAQSFKFLKAKFSFSNETLALIDTGRFKDILADPFILNRLGFFYIKNHALPENVIELYNEIKSELSDQQIEMYTTLALILELTRKSSFSLNELKALFGLNFKKVHALDLLEKSFDRKSIKFKHRNYQEYFAAWALSVLKTEDIKNFIVIPGTQKSHPSLFNTITFLLNILEEEKFNIVMEWIAAEQPEFLFKIERSRTEKFRVRIFQQYFTMQCIEKTFWIDNGNKSTAKEIAEFADCTENLTFLLQCMEKHPKKNRVVNSALHLLPFFRISGQEKMEVKRFFLDCLRERSFLKSSKAGIISCITAQKLYTDDYSYADEVFAILQGETDQEISRAMLLLIKDFEYSDRWFWYIKEEFLRQNNAVEPGYLKASRGNSFELEVLMLKLENSDNFIELLSYYFTKESKARMNELFEDGLVQRTGEFSEQEKDFIVRLLKKSGGDLSFFRRDRLLGRIIKESGNLKDAAAFLIENHKFQAASMHLASAADKNLLPLIADYYQRNLILTEEIEVFRQSLLNFNTNKELCTYFEKLMQDKGFAFAGSRNAVKDLHAQRDNEQLFFQKNFDIYFDKNLLLREIEIVFSQNACSELDLENMCKIEDKWYEENPYSGVPSVLHFLSELVQHNEFSITLEYVETVLKDDYSRFCFICELLENRKGAEEKFSVSDQQKHQIIEWTQKTADSIRFDRIIKLVSEKEYRTAEDYYRFETVMKFFELEEVDLPQEFLLNAIEFYQLDNFGKEFSFDYLKGKIANDELFNKRIIKDFSSKKFYSFVSERYVKYVMENNLVMAMGKAGEYLLKNDSGIDFESKLEKYYALTSDVELLLKCADNTDETKCWSALKILIKNNVETEFCVNKALEFLNSERRLSFYSFDALFILFQFNSPHAIVQYHKILVRGERNLTFHGSYSVINYEMLEKLFFLVFGIYYKTSRYNQSIEFLKSYVSNISRNDQDFRNTQDVLYGIKAKINKQRQDTEIYFINLLIDLSVSSHLNFISRPLSFEEAIEKAESLMG